MDLYYIIKISGDLDAEKEYKAWLATHKTTFNVIFALLRHPGYCLNNIAFYSNIERWQRLISKEFKPTNATTASPSSLRSYVRPKRYYKKWFTVICTALITISTVFMVFQMLNYQLDLYFYIY